MENEEKAIVILIKEGQSKGIDVEIPLNIAANELIYGLNRGFNLGINMDDPNECYLRVENPVALLTGEKMVKEYGIRNGSRIYVRDNYSN